MDERDSTPRRDLTATLDAVSTELAQAAREHPEADVLVAYHQDQLAPEMTDNVQEHLAACRDCGDLLLELVRFENEPDATLTESGSQVANLETETAWRELSSELESKGHIRDKSYSVASSVEYRRFRLLVAALAASLVVSLGLGGWVAGLRSELETRRQPQINVPILYLEPPGSVRGSAPRIAAGSDSDSVVLILNLPSLPPEVPHRLEIIAKPDDRLVWSRDGLMPKETGDFYLLVPQGLLPRGSYGLRLLRDGEALAVYDLDIVP